MILKIIVKIRREMLRGIGIKLKMHQLRHRNNHTEIAKDILLTITLEKLIVRKMILIGRRMPLDSIGIEFLISEKILKD